MMFRKLRILASLLVLVCVCAAQAFCAMEPDAVIGVAGTRYTGVGEPGSQSTETGVGNAAADAVLLAADADIALIPGGLIQNNIIAGEVTYERLEILFETNEPLVTAQMTPAALKTFLEDALSHIVLDDILAIDHAASEFSGYPQISGFTLRYDVSAPVGERVLDIKLQGEAELSPEDSQTVLQVASVQSMFDGSRGLPVVEYTALDVSILDAMVELTASGGLTGEETGRVRVVGSSDDTLLGDFPVLLAALILIFVVAGFRVFYHPKPSFANGFQMPPKSERFEDLAQPQAEKEE